MLLGTGTAVAQTPGWSFINVNMIPSTVSPGANAGYSFDIYNGGKSNIAQVYLLSNSTQPIVKLLTDRTTAVCQTSPTLRCSFGALNSLQKIHVLIAYTTPSSGSTFDPSLYLNATGVASDQGNNSHGDSKALTGVTTTLNSDPNFAGAFQLTGQEIGTDPTLTTSNKQSTKLSPPASATLLPVTVQDGITTFPGTGTDPCTSHTCFGDWAKLNAANGSVGPVKVTINIKGMPSNTDPLTIGLWHDGTIIMTRCSSSTLPTGTGECVTVTKSGNGSNTIFQIVGWLNHNGNVRGLLG